MLLDLLSPVASGFIVLGALSIGVAILMHWLTRRYVLACVLSSLAVSIVFQVLVLMVVRWRDIFLFAWITAAVVALPVAMLVGLAVRALRNQPASGAVFEPSPLEAAVARQWRMLRRIAATRAGYHAICIYRVPKVKVEAFLQIQRDAADIFTRLGAVSSETFRVADGYGKYGSAGLFDVVRAQVDEVVFVGIDSFENRNQFAKLMPRLNAHHEIVALQSKMHDVLEFNRVLRVELEGASEPP